MSRDLSYIIEKKGASSHHLRLLVKDYFFLPQENVTEYFSEFPNAGEWGIEFQGRSKTHSWSKALQIPEKAFSF